LVIIIYLDTSTTTQQQPGILNFTIPNNKKLIRKTKNVRFTS